MPFTPIIPLSGLGGWNFLERTLDRQMEIYNKSPDIARDVEYYLGNIDSISTLDEFMGDRRILKVALGAFGLSEEIDKGAFVRKVLEEGTLEDDSFANRLNNPNYISFAQAFSFGDFGFVSNDASNQRIVDQYRDESFEISLGEVDDDMRQALNFKREIGTIAERDLTEAGGWFQVMASLPLRSVVEAAFNLPSSFSQIDLDQQAEVLADRADQYFGSRSVDIFKDPENIDVAIRRFQLTRQIANGPASTSPAASAITILSGGLGSSGLENLILSNV
ncbi:MAG: DUF1217 domain-containing protein [Acidimicrobiales bacterium]|nr:DUF1217 domain-containing protein [Hyphomonadaceae bacterium]RZV44768.1 MAG: DUF1217 domain-containing protein [Acidimicrobiales bacterium]